MLNYDFSKGHIGLNLYAGLINKELNEKQKAKLIAEAIGELENRALELENLLTKKDAEIIKLKLEIELLRGGE